MQGRRGIFDDLNQGPNSNSRGIDESDECNSSLSPTERRLLSADLSGEINFNHNSRSFSSWDVGESSSRNNQQDQVVNDGLKLEQNWPSPFGTNDSRFKERQIDPSNGQLHDSTNRSMSIQGSGSNHIPMDVDLNLGYGGNSSNDGGHSIGFMNLYKSGSSEMEASSSSNGIGTDSSFGNWGLSCKRKALEGTSGSSSCFPEAENVVWHTLPNCSNGSSSLSASSPMLDSQEQLNSMTGVGVRDSSSFSISSAGNPGRFSNGSSSRRFLHNEYRDQIPRRPISTSADSSRPSNVQPPRNLRPFPWSDNVNSRNGSLSSSELPPESGSGNDEQNRNLVHDSANGASGSHPSNAVWMPHFDSTTRSQQRLPEFSPWTLFPSSEAESIGHRRGRFPPFPLGSSSASEENVLSSGVNSQGRRHRPFLRPAPLMEVPNDEWQTFAADIEGRHRLVSEMRQILNALQRGENLRAEDYVLFDPFINGVAELHDRHRDMRLDVDNMSYEELLALEERIGDVKTGLKEDVILKSMKQRKHISSTSNLEPCCICREEYERGDDIGSLECGHDFHTNCIKQWVEHKNVCPICKTTAFSI
ncbi:hypothetical protein L6452_23079 [Arctium lappa]|uniref:Uncharacterized protein n=1 Tax=Arctium lappa TaxID=4217 RepID=A0ACB9B2P5_ARCLA|nr:hypothetical protein L6452_23079 [Arctium lappa]